MSVRKSPKGNHYIATKKPKAMTDKREEIKPLTEDEIRDHYELSYRRIDKTVAAIWAKKRSDEFWIERCLEIAEKVWDDAELWHIKGISKEEYLKQLREEFGK